MLKKTNAPRSGSTVGGKGTGVMRLFKVHSVHKDGVVVDFTDGRGDGLFFMEATPQFVEQKNKSPNFMAKSTGAQMHEKFYMALMRPTSNPEHQYRKEQDVLSAKVYPRNGTKTVEGVGELQKVALGGGFTIFARAETQKADPFDDAIKKTTPADEIIQGYARIIHDKEAANKVTGEKGSSWMEFITEVGNPSDQNKLFDRLREVAGSKRGPSVFVRILNEQGENDMQTSVYPGKDLTEVEEEIASIRDLGLSNDRVAIWEVHPRVYLRQEFLVSATDAPSKLERLRRDITYTYGVQLDKTPIEADAVSRGERRLGGESFAIPMAVSLTMYSNDSTDGEFLPGSLRAVVPMGGELVHSKQLFMTPDQRERAALNSAPQAGQDDATPSAAEQTPAAEPRPAAGKDVDFGAGDMDFGTN